MNLDGIRDRLVENWRSAWRWWSLRLNALGLLILGFVQFDPVGALFVWNMMPSHVRAFLPSNFLLYVGLALFALSMIARMVKQPNAAMSSRRMMRRMKAGDGPA